MTEIANGVVDDDERPVIPPYVVAEEHQVLLDLLLLVEDGRVSFVVLVDRAGLAVQNDDVGFTIWPVKERQNCRLGCIAGRKEGLSKPPPGVADEIGGSNVMFGSGQVNTERGRSDGQDRPRGAAEGEGSAECGTVPGAVGEA